MSVLTGVRRRGQSAADSLFEALADPARRERMVVTGLLAYVALWTLYGTLAKASQDIHADMSEQFVLSRELAWGYPKHPPFTMALVRVWFAVFPTADWAYYLLAAATEGVTLWIVWVLSARFLDHEKRVLGIALLTLIPFFNFHALKFNVNVVLMPLWAATTLWFLRSFETRRPLDAALTGLLAAACMYGKYWSIVLLLGLGVATLVDRRRADYFRSPAPWVTIAVGALALAPHVAWLIANDFVPFSYAVGIHHGDSAASTVLAALGYLLGSVGYTAVPLGILVLIARPSRATLADMAWPADPARRLAAAAFWATLLLPAVVAPLVSIELVSLWSMSAWTLLPVMLLSSPLVVVGRSDAARVLALAVGFPIVMVMIAPAVAYGIHRAGPPPSSAHASLLVDPMARLWRETTDRPLRLFAGSDFTDGVAFYMSSHPQAVHTLDDRLTPGMEERIAREGIAMLCPERAGMPETAPWCVNAGNAVAARFPEGKRAKVEVVRYYLGVAGEPARYLLFAIPPQQPLNSGSDPP